MGGGRHIADAIAEKEGKKWVISMKWQQTSGTAEQKVPFEVMSLTEILLSGDYECAYLVLGGPGWSLRDFYVGGGLQKYLTNMSRVRVVTLEDFVAKANGGGL
jgi:hypothetical protein